MPGGSLCAKAAMRAMIRLVCRQEGPTMPIEAFGCVTAYFSSNADIVSVLPLCLHQRAAVNWLFSDISELFLIGKESKTQDLLKKVSGIST